MPGFVHVFGNACAPEIHGAKDFAGVAVAFFGGFGKPVSCPGRIFIRPLSIHEQGAEIVLCTGFTAPGGFFEPVVGRFFVFGGAEAFQVDDAHEGLRFGIAAIGRAVEPFGGPDVVLFGSLALKVHDAQHGLCLVIAQRCRFFELRDGLFVLSGGV